jgi:hypothetical protein
MNSAVSFVSGAKDSSSDRLSDATDHAEGYNRKHGPATVRGTVRKLMTRRQSAIASIGVA